MIANGLKRSQMITKWSKRKHKWSQIVQKLFPNSSKWLLYGTKLFPNCHKGFPNCLKWLLQRVPNVYKMFSKGYQMVTDLKWMLQIDSLKLIYFIWLKLMSQNWKSETAKLILTDIYWLKLKLNNWYQVGDVGLWSSYFSHTETFLLF